MYFHHKTSAVQIVESRRDDNVTPGALLAVIPPHRTSVEPCHWGAARIIETPG
jgi:hypothetical protein